MINYKNKNWLKYQNSCYILNIISHFFLLIPFILNKKNKILYLYVAISSFLLHLHICKFAKNNLYLQLIELFFIFKLIFYNMENIQNAFFKNKYILIFIFTLAVYFYIKSKIGLSEFKPNHYHIYHSLWHILMSLILIIV